jgi:hypothetical protein
MKGVNMVLSNALIDPVKQYQKKRMYNSISQASNELIRIGLEQVNSK